MREPRKFSIGNLLNTTVRYEIPHYQRGYDWKDDTQVRDLFVDLTSCLESSYGDNLFLGTMIFDVSQEKSEGLLEVIDGQQRLTTLVIALIAARDFAREKLNDGALALTIQGYIANSNALSETSFDRLSASGTIADVFSKMCEFSWDGVFPNSVKKDGKLIYVRRQVGRLRPIYGFCMNQISEYCGTDVSKFRKLVNQIIEHTFVIRIEIEDRAEAFEIFERTNARGKGLEVSDLLKNFLFSKGKEVSDHDITEVWDEIVDGFGDNILRGLKYFWVSRRGAVTSRDLYRKLRYYAGEIGVNSFVEQLSEFSKFYSAYSSDDADITKDWLIEKNFPANDMYLKEFRRVCSVLRLFSVTQVIPFIFSLMKAYEKAGAGEKNAKKVLTMLRTLESFHFVNNKICNRIGNESEKSYSEFSEDLYQSDDMECITKMMSWFQKAMANKDDFKGSFSAISYSNRLDRITIRYVFDKLVNHGVKDGQRIDLVDIDAMQKGVRSSFDIEHLLCQSDEEADEGSEIVHQIGNLIVIPRQINGIMSNAPFEKKMDMLRQPWNYDNNIKNVPTYLQEFVAQYGEATWDEEAIRARNVALADAVYEVSVTGNVY